MEAWRRDSTGQKRHRSKARNHRPGHDLLLLELNAMGNHTIMSLRPAVLPARLLASSARYRSLSTTRIHRADHGEQHEHPAPDTSCDTHECMFCPSSGTLRRRSNSDSFIRTFFRPSSYPYIALYSRLEPSDKTQLSSLQHGVTRI